jgi:hypothetical protein
MVAAKGIKSRKRKRVLSSSTQLSSHRRTMATAKAIKSHKSMRKQSSKAFSSQVSAFFAESHWKEIGLPSAKAARTAFWDDLRHVPTCRNALREFDRRTTLNARSSATMNMMSDLPDTMRTTATSEVVSAHLKSFARRGGPDTRNLRGVSSIHHYCRLCRADNISLVQYIDGDEVQKAAESIDQGSDKFK